MRTTRWAAVAAFWWLLGCGSREENLGARGGDSGGSDAGDASVELAGGDAATDANGSGDRREDADPTPPDPVTFVLVNTNPMRTLWVTRGYRSAFYSVAGADGQPLRIFHDCGYCECGQDPCAVCDVAPPEAIPVAPDEEITGTWDGGRYELRTEGGMTCQERLDPIAGSFTAEFCWSYVEPEDGVIPADTRSCTRIPFTLGEDTTVRYEAQ